MTINPKLLEPTLLWSNPNPNQAFNETYNVVFNTNNAHLKFKYLVFEIKHFVGSSNTETQFVKVPSTIGNPVKEDIYFVHAGYMAVRQVGMYGSQNYIGNCYIGEAKTQNNEACIPVRIYGTNIL